MVNYQNKLSIPQWAEDDRPREKLMLKGASALSDAELIAILLTTGSREESAVALAQRMLRSTNEDLNELGKISIRSLMQFKGIGQAKAITIVAAMELGRRRQVVSLKSKPKIKSSEDAYQLMAPFLKDLPHEEFWILLLNRANVIIGREPISKGGVTGTYVDAKIIFKHALLQLASSIILFHNHPSGQLVPSQSDIDTTRKLRAAGRYLDITVLDHLIISDKGYYSFADEKLI